MPLLPQLASQNAQILRSPGQDEDGFGKGLRQREGRWFDWTWCLCALVEILGCLARKVVGVQVLERWTRSQAASRCLLCILPCALYFQKPPLRIIDLHVDEQHAAEADHHHQKDLKITPRGKIVAREGRSPAVAYYPDVPHHYLTHEDISHAQGSLDIGPIKRRVPISLMRGRTQLNRRDPRAPSYAFRGVPAE